MNERPDAKFFYTRRDVSTACDLSTGMTCHVRAQVLLSSFLADACAPFVKMGSGAALCFAREKALPSVKFTAGAYDCVRVHVELLSSDGSDACVAVQVMRARRACRGGL